jgi:hypothetical protein
MLSSPDADILLVHFSRKTRGNFVTEKVVVTKCLINFKSFDRAFTELFSSHLVSIRQLLYKMETMRLKPQFLPQLFLYRRMLDMKFPIGSCSWLSRDSQESFTNAATAFTLTDKPFVYKPPIPTCDSAGFRHFDFTRRCEASLNSFRRGRLMKSQAISRLLRLRGYIPLIVVGELFVADML